MRRRIAAVAVLAVGLALGTAGCTFLAPQASLIKYDPSDGVSLNVGDIQLRNAFVISPNGEDANLIGVLINNSSSEANVELQYTTHVKGAAHTASTVVEMAAGQVISFGNPKVKQLVLANTEVKAGALLKVFVQYGGHSGKSVLLPVLDNNFSYYKDLAPSPTPVPIPSLTPVPAATDSSGT